MAKVSPVSIKYMVHATFKADGPLEKPDVIGALFGQTEGLLGNELEMRELQKEGKIGRIEVELEIVDGKSIGEIKIPSALDKSATTLVAAALETIDRVGPTEAIVKITKIEDVRGSKRDFILDRAKQLLSGLEESNGIESMSKALKEEARISKIQEYGEEKLPAGDLSDNEIIVVEGRADVVNLLKNRVNNVIGMNGTKLPAEIAKLGNEKTITLFIDGDRGGKLIAKNVMTNAKIAYVATAPDGKEVEELEAKEILTALRKKFPLEEYIRRERINLKSETREAKEPEVQESVQKFSEEEIKKLVREKYKNIKDSKQAVLLNNNLETVKTVNQKDITKSIYNMKNKVLAILLDGIATSSIISACSEAGIKYLAATKFANVSDSASVKLISL